MPFEETLRKVEYDLARGDLEHAKQRLTGMIGFPAYPGVLELRRMLGDIHWLMGKVIEAGRYWYLEEHKTPEMQSACQRYEKACGNSAQTIGRRLKFQGNIKRLKQNHPYAADLLIRLQERAWGELGGKPPFMLFDSSAYEQYCLEHYRIIGRDNSQLLERLSKL